MEAAKAQNWAVEPQEKYYCFSTNFKRYYEWITPPYQYLISRFKDVEI
jgi:hypothetical protein